LPDDDSALWLLTHKPVWYDLIAAEGQPNALQAVLRERAQAFLPPATVDRVQLVISGHAHVFQTLNFAGDADRQHYPQGRPAQLLVGGGGTQLEARDPQSPLYEADRAGSRERLQVDARLYDGVPAASGLLLNRYTLLLLERGVAGWQGQVLDAQGRRLANCALPDGQKALRCTLAPTAVQIQ